MKLDAKALGLSLGILCGAFCLVLGLLNLWFGYGQAYVLLANSLTPGVASGTYFSVLLHIIYGLISGYVGGYIFGWLYNQFAKK